MLRTLLAAGIVMLAGCANAQDMRPRPLLSTVQRPSCSPAQAFVQDLNNKGYVVSVVATRGPIFSAIGPGNFVMAYSKTAWVAFIMNGKEACFIDAGSRYRVVDAQQHLRETPQSFPSPTPESEGQG